MRGSSPASGGDRPVVEVVFGAGDGPSIAMESVSRHYERLRVGRTRRMFAVFGGIEGGVGPMDEEEDDDDGDDGFEADEDEAESVAVDGTVALDAVSLRVSGAGCLGVVGPPGSGKSVLARTVAGITPPSSGRVVVHGSLGPILAPAAGFLGRQGRLSRRLPMLAAVLRLPVRDVRRRLPEIFDFLGDPDAGKLPISSLSTKRRLDIVFALVLSLDLDIVVVDCPLPAGAYGERCRSRLRDLKNEGTLVLVTAQAPDGVAWIADRMIEMKQGRIVSEHGVEVDPEPLASDQAQGEDRPGTSF